MPRQNLDPQTVIAAAAELVNTEGPQALSLARLAQRLGVRTPSLYNHIDGLPGLLRDLELLSARGLADALGAAVMGRAGSDALHALAAAYRKYALTNPGLYALAQRSAQLPPLDPAYAAARQAAAAALSAAQERVLQPVLAVIASFDMAGSDAIHAVRALRSLVHGFVSLELAGGFGMPLDVDESYRRTIDLFARALEAQRRSA